MMPGETVKQGQLNPAAISAPDAARLLTAAAGIRVDEDQIAADIESGAPTNTDGSLNLVHYAAWLVRQLAQRGGGARGND